MLPEKLQKYLNKRPVDYTHWDHMTTEEQNTAIAFSEGFYSPAEVSYFLCARTYIADVTKDLGE